MYNTCLQLQRYAISLLKPGITIQHYHELLGDEATRLFLKVGLLKESDVKNEDPENRAYQKYLYHGISHFLGIDVHDLGSKTEPLIPGMVLTVEPGIYVEEEQIGIRIENNVLITEKGNIDLMQQIPVEADDIERLMRK